MSRYMSKRLFRIPLSVDVQHISIFLDDLKERGLKQCLLKTSLLRKNGRRCKEAFEALKVIPEEGN